MKTLLIVEDEKMIRQGIHAMILRSGVPIETIIECNNGEAAWEVLQENHIDVMFTDIRMPKMDGIELVRLTKTMKEPPLVVAISGFDDFSYAVEMLRNGVREYILKPVERDKISKILRELDDELNGRHKEAEQEKSFGKQQLQFLITKTDASAEELASYDERYGSFFYQGSYVICIFEKGAIKSSSEGIILVDGEPWGDIAVVEETNKQAFIQSELPESCIGISGSHRGILELREAYEEAVEARKKAFATAATFCFGDEEGNIPEALIKEAEKLVNEQANMQRLQLIGTSRTDELDKQWERLFIETNRQHLKLDDFIFAINDFCTNAGKIYKNAIDEEMQETLTRLSNVLAYRSLDEYREELTDWIVMLHEKLHSENDMGSNRKLKQAVEYIEANYDKDLNMAVVSNYISMNYSMLSYLFKQYTGTNFVNYLKNVRMQAALRLLKETDLKVIEISQKVGYENEKHFMKIFKSEFGVSPTEYRKNMQRNE